MCSYTYVIDIGAKLNVVCQNRFQILLIHGTLLAIPLTHSRQGRETESGTAEYVSVQLILRLIHGYTQLTAHTRQG